MERVQKYKMFPAFLSIQHIKDLFEGKYPPQELYEYFEHLETITLHNASGVEYLVVISSHEWRNLTCMEIIFNVQGRYVRARHVVEKHLLENAELRDRLKRELMHKILDAFIDGMTE